MEGASEVQMAREVIRLRKTFVENSSSPYAELLVLNYFNHRFFPRKRRVRSSNKIQTSATKTITCVRT